jgi:hypothetical protein
MTALDGVRNVGHVGVDPSLQLDDLSARVVLVRLRGNCTSQHCQCGNTHRIVFMVFSAVDSHALRRPIPTAAHAVRDRQQETH